MRRITGLLLGLMVFAGAGSALAQLDCTGDPCPTTKYGLGEFPDYRNDKVPVELTLIDYSSEDFGPDLPECVGGTTPGQYCVFDTDCGGVGTCKLGVSYYFNNATSGSDDCNFERGFFPYTGQIFLRERTDCTPTTTGPTCAAGVNAGKPCHVVPPDQAVTGFGNFHSVFPGIECPGSTCQDNGGGCRVEIPISDGGGLPGGGWTDPGNTSDGLLPTITVGTILNTNFILSAHASQTWGGSSHGFCSGGPTPEAMCRSNADCGGATCTLSKGVCQSGPTPGTKCTTDSECGGAAGSCKLAVCNPFNFRLKPSMGTRYLLPTSRGGNPTDPVVAARRTYVRWDYGSVDPNKRVSDNTALRSHSDDSTTCCQSTLTVCSILISGSSAVYPVLNQRDCSVTAGSGVSGRNAFSTEDSLTADWVFAAGRGSAFSSDREHILPGQIPGVCRQNRQTPCTNAAPNAASYLCTGPGAMGARAVPCCTGVETGTCSTNSLCTALRAPYDCCTGNLTGTCGTECPAGDTCDLREPHRAQINPGRTAFGEPRPTFCAAAMYYFRGTPNRGCTVQPQYFAPGDPGPDCGVLNYGRDRRSDQNCDGVADLPDKCPFVSEWDQTKDADGDCADGVGGDCRGDECECGDQNGDGKVNVSDLVDINLAIFGSVDTHRLCDANSDLNCNVSDIVGANVEIFDPDSSSCRHITSSRCGDNVVNPGEACDDGARCTIGGAPTATACDATAANTCPAGQQCSRIGGDGCNTSCRVE